MASVPHLRIEPQPAQVSDAAFARAQREAEFWQTHRAEYNERFPDEHIAVTEDDQVVAHDRDLLEFDRLVRAAGLTRDRTFETFLMNKTRLVL